MEKKYLALLCSLYTMLEQAKIKVKNKKFEINFIKADIRNLHLTKKFDFIFIPFNSIHHLYENQDLFSTLKVVEKDLKDEGFFVFDCYNPNIQYITEAEKAKNKITEYTTSDDRKVEIEQTMSYENKTQI